MSKNKQAHWAIQMAEEVKARIDSDPSLQEVVERQGILVYDEKTPSGIIHIGSGRGWVIHDVVAKSLRSLGLKAEFVLSSDDYDPYDKPNKDLDESIYNPYLGVPFCDIPSPVEGYASFGDYYFKESTEKFSELGIECDLESTADNYRKGLFNPQIKKILDNTEKVQGIYKKLYGPDSEGGKKLPFNVKCPECGKIATTIAHEWDGQKELLRYECREDVVDWATGCGASDWVSPYDGGGKFPWKVEWAAKWPTRGVIVEFAGKDHFSKGGSRTCANMIAMDVLGYPPPYPSRGYSTGPGYEFFQIGGAKMSTSKGRGMSFADGVDFFSGKMLRFLLLKSKPNSVVDFDPEKNDILLLTDHYDRCERIYFGAEDVDEKVKNIQSELYKLISIGEVKSSLSPQVPLNLASTLLQVTLSKEGAVSKLKELGHIPENLSDEDVASIHARLELAERWLNRFASEQFVFKLVTEDNGFEDLDESQCQILEKFIEFLASSGPAENAKVLHNSFYDFCREIGCETKDLFKTAYLALISKDRGPQLANFILTVGVDKIIALLKASLRGSRSR